MPNHLSPLAWILEISKRTKPQMLKDEHHGRHHKLVKVEICVDAFALVVALIQLGLSLLLPETLRLAAFGSSGLV